MKSSLRFLALLLVSMGAGCFNPQVKDLGFACSLADVDPCPVGFQCINGFCDNGSGARRTPTADLSAAKPADMAQQQSLPDLAKPVIHDMAKPPLPDMSLPPDLMPACVTDGNACAHSSDCCSGHCHTLSTLVCFG
jgi:hypothetical protein